MVPEEQIRQVLHANRVLPLTVAKPHGPLGLEQLATAVSRIDPALGPDDVRVRRAIGLDQATWAKLDRLAETTTQTTSQHVTAKQISGDRLQGSAIRPFIDGLMEQLAVKAAMVSKCFRAWTTVMIPTAKRSRWTRITCIDLLAGPGHDNDGAKLTLLLG